MSQVDLGDFLAPSCLKRLNLFPSLPYGLIQKWVFYVTKANIYEPTKLQPLRYGHDAVSFISWPAEILASVYELSNSSPFSDSNGPIN